MKSKLVKYPYSEKKYRWDTWKQGKEFQYYWDESLPNNFETIEPYIKRTTVATDGGSKYGYIVLQKDPTKNGYLNSYVDFDENGETLLQGNYSYYGYKWFIIERNMTNYITNIKYIKTEKTERYIEPPIYTNNELTTYSCVYYTYCYDNSNKLHIVIHNDYYNALEPNGHCLRGTMFCWKNTTNTTFDIQSSADRDSLVQLLANNLRLSYTDIVLEVALYNRQQNPNGLIIDTNTNWALWFPRVSYSNTKIDDSWEKVYTFNDTKADVDNYVNFSNLVDFSPSNIININLTSTDFNSSTLFNYLYNNDNNETNNYIINFCADNGFLDFSTNNRWKYIENKSMSSANDFIITRNNNAINVISKCRIADTMDDWVFNGYWDDRDTYAGFRKVDFELSRLLANPYHTVGEQDGWECPWTDKLKINPLICNTNGYYQPFNRNHYLADQSPWTSAETHINFNLSNYEIPARCFKEVDNKIIAYIMCWSTISLPTKTPYFITSSVDVSALSKENIANANKLLVNVDTWENLLSNEDINYQIIKSPKSTDNVYEPIIKLIGDQTNNSITIPSGNTDILEYTLGEGINRQFVAKTLQYNAPCEYVNGAVSSRTWLTYNSYTAQEWQNGFHFEGTQWNNIGSPFAYLNAITSSTGNRKMVYTFAAADPGTYENIFSIVNGGFAVNDSLNNSYISINDLLEDYRHYYDDNVGSLWYFGSGTVTSTDRHAYPDEGSQNYHTYRLRPEDTVFNHYFRERVTLTNVELFSDRYKYTHDTVDFCDRSYEGTVCGTSTSTGEENIPDGTWREYMGLYLGESIPFLGIVETQISPSNILGVPQYDKQVNTSDTLKYGTVASASLSFTLNVPVAQAMNYNNVLLILYYDFANNNNWERLGFFRIDTIEALDEYSTSIVAHDEAYKLNKYVDDFLEAYTQSTTLDLFYRDLLDYCGCFYDTHQSIIHNGNLAMTNVYHAVKTTGVQVAHYVANLSPGFIHADIDGDIQLSQYQTKNNTLTVSDYTNLVYTAYNTDMLNKIKIVSSNAVKGEDSGTGQNVYFLADNPLLSELQATSYFNNLATGILQVYKQIPKYRPATIDFLILPRSLAIGDIVTVITPNDETYRVIVMAMNINGGGIEIKSFGTQTFPVEAESNSEFVNLINDMGEISGDVSNMMEAQRTMATAIADNAADIANNTTDITALQSTTGTHTSQISALQTLTNGFGVSSSGNLGTVNLNGTLANLVQKAYIDDKFSSSTSNNLANIKINGSQVNNLATKNYVDNKYATTFTMKTGSLAFKTSSDSPQSTVNGFYIGNAPMTYGLFVPYEAVTNKPSASAVLPYRYFLFQITNGAYRGFYEMTDEISIGSIYSATFTEN